MSPLTTPPDLTTAQLIDIQAEKIHTSILTIKLLLRDKGADQLVLPETLDEYAPADLTPDEAHQAEAAEAEEALGR